MEASSHWNTSQHVKWAGSVQQAKKEQHSKPVEDRGRAETN